MPIYRIMNIDDYEAAYALWIKCGNGLNDKDDSREGIDKYLNTVIDVSVHMSKDLAHRG